MKKNKTTDFIKRGMVSWECILYTTQDYLFFNFECWKGKKSCQLAVKITKKNRCTVAYRRDQQQGKILGKILWLGSCHIWTFKHYKIIAISILHKKKKKNKQTKHHKTNNKKKHNF